MKTTFRFTPLATAILMMASMVQAPAQAQAQDYPNKPLRLVVPFAPGGSTDVLARLIGQKLTQTWGQPVVVDSRPGASGIVGADIVAKAAPDGYTLLLTSSAFAVSPSLYAKVPYDPVRDFSAVTQVISGYEILGLHPSVPARSVKELIALAKAKPEQLSFASAGSGTPGHMAAELFKSLAKVNLLHVPYKGGGPATVAVLSGEVSLTFNGIAPMLPHVRTGRLKGLGVSGLRRSPMVPELPTIAEAGIPGYEINAWYGMLVPTATPKDIVTKLNAEVVRILSLPEVVKQLHAHGAESAGNKPNEFAAFVKSEIAKWATVAKAAKLVAQ